LRLRALAKGFVYTPAQDLADVATLAEIMDRLRAIPTNPVPSKKDADAVLGLIERPSVKISQAMSLYCEEIAVGDLLGKSDEQKKSWRKVKMRALNNFIKINGDLPMDEITRDHARKYYNWWAGRVAPRNGIKPLTANSANRDIGNIRKLYREFWEYEGDENRQNPFRNLSFAKQPSKDRTSNLMQRCLTFKFVLEQIASLKPLLRHVIFHWSDALLRPLNAHQMAFRVIATKGI